MTLRKAEINYKTVSLSDHCSFRIGGITDNFCEPSSAQQLAEVLRTCRERGYSPVITGYGANILFPDKPVNDQSFISMKALSGISYERSAQKFTVLAGTPISFLALLGLITGTDYSFTYLLPGSAGAAVFMNARYMDREMSDIVTGINYLDPCDLDAGEKEISATDACFKYKQSIFQEQKYIITSVDFSIDTDVSTKQFAAAQDYLKLISEYTLDLCDIKLFNKQIRSLYDSIKREYPCSLFTDIEAHRDRYRHFEFYSAGSVFKNDRRLGKPIGQIVDELNLKGTTIGDAQISQHHGNIIINRGKAVAADVCKLIDIISEGIFREYEIMPQLELRII